jgi:hypothetical protein
MTPEQVFEKNEASDWDGKLLKFNACSDNDRVEVIKKFVAENENNPKLKEELRTARRFLERSNDSADI